MSKIDKAKERLSLCPKDYTYSEAKYLLTQLGFQEFNKGKTSGSRVKFYRVSDQRIILLHKPHLGDEYWCDQRFGSSFRGDGGIMKNNIMEYKGYHTKIEFDAESMVLRGKIEGINDYVDFEAGDISSIEAEFHSAVDDYLEFCKEVGKTPEKEYKGTFNVRISPVLHKKLAFCAFKDGCSLNAEIEKAVAAFVDNDQSQTRALAESVRDLTETIRMDNSRYVNETTVTSENVIPIMTLKHTYMDEVK